MHSRILEDVLAMARFTLLESLTLVYQRLQIGV